MRFAASLISPVRREPVLYVALGAIVLLAVSVRLVFASAYEGSQGWGVQVVINANIAHNLARGEGYYASVSPALHDASSAADPPLTWEEAKAFPEAPLQRPIAYYLPGYPYLAASLWQLTGWETYGALQVTQAVVDGALGSVSVFVLLAVSGRRRAGLIAMLGYALAPPLIIQSALVLPDSLASSTNLLVLAFVAGGFATGRVYAGAIAAGLALGLGSWLRGDSIALVPFLLLAVLALGLWPLQTRLRWSGAFLVAWAVPVLCLGLFFQQVYGELHLTRPGAGILLWEGIGQQDNPWDIVAPPGRNLDAAALALLQPQGLEYGTWRADNFLRDEAVRHMQSRPGWFIAPTLKRFWRVTTLQKPPEAATNLPGTVASASRIAGPFLLPLAALGLWLARGSPLLRNLLLVAWLSRVLPFSFLRDELRFEILIVAVYVVLLAVVVDEALTRAGGVRPADQEPRAVA